VSPHFQAMAERVAALMALRDAEPVLILASAPALLYPLPHPDEFSRMPFVIRRGERAEPRDLAARLDALGYQRSDLVDQAGEFAQRGGVLDIYTPLNEYPRRLEFLGDEVESIRRFDHETQRSSDPVDSIVVPPVREYPWGPEVAAELARRLEGRPGSKRRIAEIAEALRTRGSIPGMEACAGMVARARYDLFDHAADAVVIVDEPFLGRAALEASIGSLETSHAASDGIYPPPEADRAARDGAGRAGGATRGGGSRPGGGRRDRPGAQLPRSLPGAGGGSAPRRAAGGAGAAAGARGRARRSAAGDPARIRACADRRRRGAGRGR